MDVPFGVSKETSGLSKTMQNIFLGFINLFIFIYALATILRIANATTVLEGLLLGTLVWFGIIAMHESSVFIWE